MHQSKFGSRLAHPCSSAGRFAGRGKDKDYAVIHFYVGAACALWLVVSGRRRST